MKPILFNTDMVRAILDGRKTVTRRVVKGANPGWLLIGLDDDMVTTVTKNGIETETELPDLYLVLEGPRGEYETFKSPYRPGDVLYVREALWKGVEGVYEYKADYDDNPGYIWTPSIHMPREAARIFLLVTDVRVERLQEISNDDLTRDFCICKDCISVFDEFQIGDICKSIWDGTINQKYRALYGWDANPYVFVIEFERISKEEALRCT